jgi:ferritin-like protein
MTIEELEKSFSGICERVANTGAETHEDLAGVFEACYDRMEGVSQDAISMAKSTASSLVDHEKCAVCKRWRHVEDMLIPHDKTDDLCCDEGCCEVWNDRQDRS